MKMSLNTMNPHLTCGRRVKWKREDVILICCSIYDLLKGKIIYASEVKQSINTWKKCSTSLFIREMQIKTTVKYHLTLVGVAIRNIYKQYPFALWWECKLAQLLWTTGWGFLRKLGIRLHMTQPPHYWAYALKKPEFKKTHVPQCSLQHYLQ